MRTIRIATVLLCGYLSLTVVYAATKNGFDLRNALVQPAEIMQGGPPRDGIPAIDNPQFIHQNQVSYLSDDDIVMSFSHRGVVRAYPTNILLWHEIVNDTIAGKPIVVTYCPLCGTGMVFDRTVADKVRSFGVSGLLYRSDVLMYDRSSESLWTQLGLQAISGALRGTRLQWLASEQMTWAAWRKKYPNGEVLSRDTGHNREYGTNAYAGYFSSAVTMFPVPRNRQELPEKSWVVGVIVGDQKKAYPVDALLAHNTIQDRVGGKLLSISYDQATKQPAVTLQETGVYVPSVLVFWFAWQAFYPETNIWQP